MNPLEQSVKDLQAKNAEFQAMILNLAKGQEELKALLTKKEKKAKKPVSVLNLGRRFRGPLRKVKEIEEEVEQEEGASGKTDQTSNNGSGKQDEEEEEYYDDEEYPEDKYRQLEERMKAVEIQKIPGLDFEELGLISGVVIPPKFKTPTFAKYDGVSCPKLHLKSYVRKIQPHTTDKMLWIHLFQESLSGTQLEWYYQLEGTNIRTWEDLAVAFYTQYQYNSDLAPTRKQLQSMSMGPKESFKDYLLGSSSAGFTDLILTGERVESGIRSGKIQVATSSGVTKKPYSGKTEANAVHSQRGRNRNDSSQSVGAVLISTPTPRQNQQQGYQHRQDAPRRKFTKINMPLSQALQYLLKASLITVRDPPKTTNTTSPGYNPNAKCAYHSYSPGHDANSCWALKNKIQDMIDAGEIEFDPPETPNVITAPMPKHDKAVNAVDQESYVTNVMNLTTPLPLIKKKLLQADLFPGCIEDCYYCSSQSNGCTMLKTGIQCLMDSRTIMFEKVPSVENLCEDLAQNLKFEDVSVISRTPVRIPTKGPIKITTEPKVAPLIITKPGPIPYSSDKAVPWSYGNDVYIHGVKQEALNDEPVKVPSLDVDNIVGTSKVTRSGRIFSPGISPGANTSTQVSVSDSTADVRGKGPMPDPVQTPVEATAEEVSQKEMDEILKIIRKSDYDVIEQLGHTSSKISMLSLLTCSEAHAKALMKFLKAAHVPQEISVNQFENCVASLTTNNYLGFSDADLTPAGKSHNKALHISIECKGTTLSHVLVDNGSSLNVLPKMVLDRLDSEGMVLKPSNVVVKAFDGTKSTVYGEVELPIRVGSQAFNSLFYVMDIHPAYSCLLGRPWIHGAGAVTSTLHQKLKYLANGKIVTVHGEEEYVVSHVNEYKYIEVNGEFIETPCQTFELVPQVVSSAKHTPTVPKVTRIPPTMASLKDAKAVVEEGGCTVWGQLIDVPYKSDKLGLGCTAGTQKNNHHTRLGGLMSHFVSKGVNALEDGESNCNLDKWIFPTPDHGLNNWKTEDVISISFNQE
ncbi:uncharacterized protein LOC131658035 [Vicia villosa]|uniref:uncharacterized protein LOC131658035 n=1 Tax=Vicia villosa TaxID=3911 RepID=UPI00273B83E9|nr:uncharacterized protein LOC131658035 [Vicia villosa]